MPADVQEAGEEGCRTPPSRPAKLIDAYGFEVREELAELFKEFRVQWEEEEQERLPRWQAFLDDLAEQRKQSGLPPLSNTELVYRAHAVWRASQSTTGASVESATETDLLAGQRLATLVQAGIPRAMRPWVWPCLLGVPELAEPGEYQALVACAFGDDPGTPQAETSSLSSCSGDPAEAQLQRDGLTCGDTPGYGIGASDTIQAFQPQSMQLGADCLGAEDDKELGVPRLENDREIGTPLACSASRPNSGESGVFPPPGVEQSAAPALNVEGGVSMPSPPGGMPSPETPAEGSHAGVVGGYKLHRAGSVTPPSSAGGPGPFDPATCTPGSPSSPFGSASAVRSPQHDEWLTQVDKDLHRTFPGHAAMGRRGRAALRRVLAAYAVRNPAVGYCQGLNFVAAGFLLFMPEPDAFWCLAAVVERVLPGYFDAQLTLPALDARILTFLLRGAFPATAAHLQALEVDFGSMTLQWFLCIFVNSLPAEPCFRVWDLLFLEGSPVALFRTVLALMDGFNVALCATSESSDAYMLLQGIAPLTLDGSRLCDTAAIGFRHIRASTLQVLRVKFTAQQRAQPSLDSDAGHHISWDAGSALGLNQESTDNPAAQEQDLAREAEDPEVADTATDAAPADEKCDTRVAHAELAKASECEDKSPDAVAPPSRSNSSFFRRALDSAALQTSKLSPGIVRALAAAADGPSRPVFRPRRRTLSAAAALQAPGKQLFAFLGDKRRPSVAAALEAARPSPMRAPSKPRLDLGTPGDDRPPQPAKPTARRGLDAVQPLAATLPRVLGLGRRYTEEETVGALEASMQLLRRHTVACEARESPPLGHADDVPVNSPTDEDVAAAAGLLAALEQQVAKVSGLKSSKEALLAELKGRNDELSRRLRQMESARVKAASELAATQKALEGKRASLARVKAQLSLLMQEAEQAKQAGPSGVSTGSVPGRAAQETQARPTHQSGNQAGETAGNQSPSNA